jgi:hypothetical protein
MDLSRMVEIAAEADILTIVDSTCPIPVNLRPPGTRPRPGDPQRAGLRRESRRGGVGADASDRLKALENCPESR